MSSPPPPPIYLSVFSQFDGMKCNSHHIAAMRHYNGIVHQYFGLQCGWIMVDVRLCCHMPSFSKASDRSGMLCILFCLIFPLFVHPTFVNPNGHQCLLFPRRSPFSLGFPHFPLFPRIFRGVPFPPKNITENILCHQGPESWPNTQSNAYQTIHMM